MDGRIVTSENKVRDTEQTDCNLLQSGALNIEGLLPLLQGTGASDTRKLAAKYIL